MLMPNNSLLGLIVLTAALTSQADAQLVTYQFTGTRIHGTAGIGNSIIGSVTLDVGAAPDLISDYGWGCGEYADWRNGGFSVDGMTDAGIVAGTSQGDNTVFWNEDDLCSNFHQTGISSYTRDGGDGLTPERGFQIYSTNYTATGDGIANVPNPWDPNADEYQIVLIWDYYYSTATYEWGYFTLDTFTLGPTTIIIDGCATGIDDFEYQGKMVSSHLADCAAGAENHGHYVSCVAKLTDDLKEAGLLTDDQKNLIMECAGKSNIGK